MSNRPRLFKKGDLALRITGEYGDPAIMYPGDLATVSEDQPEYLSHIWLKEYPGAHNPLCFFNVSGYPISRIEDMRSMVLKNRLSKDKQSDA